MPINHARGKGTFFKESFLNTQINKEHNETGNYRDQPNRKR